jgi:membrane protein required for colicin V production
MNALDIIIIAVLAFCVIRSLRTGFIGEIFSILGVIGGIVIGSRCYHLLFPYVGRVISNEDYMKLLSFTLLFLVVFLMAILVGMSLKALLRAVFIGWVDHTLGALFGLLKGVFYISVLMWVLTTFLPKGSAFIVESRLAPYVTYISRGFVLIIPDNLRDVFGEKQKEMQKLWHDKTSP